MVLGVQWLSDLGTVKWDFKRLVIEFDLGNCHHVLKGISLKGVNVSSRIDSQNLIANSTQLYFMQLITPYEDEDNLKIFSCASEVSAVPHGVQEILKKYEQIFDEPTGLPPTRGVFDHRIPLESGANPVSIRPYRYALKQKDIIEKLVQQMLNQGIIRDSCSPFASPVVLVGKKDGSWRLCVDYRDLNKKRSRISF